MVFESLKEKFKKKEPESTVNEESLSYEEIINMEQSYDKYEVPTDAKQLWTIVNLEFKHFMKTKSFFILFALAAIVPLLQMTGLLDIVGKITDVMAIFGGVKGDISANVYMHYCLGLVPLVMLLCMVFFCGKTISNEYANRTAFLNMPQPMNRWVIFTGKFIAISLITFSIVLFAYGMSFLATSLKYDQIIIMPVFQSLIVTFICVLGITATGMFFSALMKNRGGAVSFLVMFVLFPIAIPVLCAIVATVMHGDANIEFLKYTLPFIIDESFMLISYDPLFSIPSIMLALTQTPILEWWAMLLLALLWGAAFFAGGMYLFDKKEV